MLFNTILWKPHERGSRVQGYPKMGLLPKMQCFLDSQKVNLFKCWEKEMNKKEKVSGHCIGFQKRQHTQCMPLFES